MDATNELQRSFNGKNYKFEWCHSARPLAEKWTRRTKKPLKRGSKEKRVTGQSEPKIPISDVLAGDLVHACSYLDPVFGAAVPCGGIKIQTQGPAALMIQTVPCLALGAGILGFPLL